jgi:hypothetical protein
MAEDLEKLKLTERSKLKGGSRNGQKEGHPGPQRTPRKSLRPGFKQQLT